MGKEDLDHSCDDDDYGISSFVFPSSKMKQRELEYNIQKDTQVLKQEAKKRAMKRDLHNKKKTIHQFKTEETEMRSHHMSASSYNDHDYGSKNDYDMKVDVDILNESLGQSSSSFSKLYFSTNQDDVQVKVATNVSSDAIKKKDKMKKLFQGMKRRLSMTK